SQIAIAQLYRRVLDYTDGSDNLAPQHDARKQGNRDCSQQHAGEHFHYGFYPVAGTGKRCRGELLLQGQQAAELPGKTVEIRTYNPKKRYRLRWVAQGSLFHVRQTVRITFQIGGASCRGGRDSTESN